MKKIALLILISLIGCKKQPMQTTTAADSYKAGKITVLINSNYKYPFARVEQDGLINKLINNGTKQDSTEIKYEFTGTKGKWAIYSTCSKNGADSTKDMKDGNLIWESLIIKLDSVVIFSDSETRKPGYSGVDNSYTFTLN